MKFMSGPTTYSFVGERMAHAYVARTFAKSIPMPLQLVATARQFSSYLVLVGTMVSGDEFAPDHGIILKNKDEVVIPLLMEPLPPPTQFADAIES